MGGREARVRSSTALPHASRIWPSRTTCEHTRALSLLQASVLRPAVVRSFVSGRSQQKGDLEDLRAARAQFRQQVQQAQRRAPEEVEEDEEEQGEEEDYLNDDYEDEDFDELDDAPKVATVGFPAPAFSATALMPGGTFAPLHAHELAGKWTVLFFYPLDFTVRTHDQLR